MPPVRPPTPAADVTSSDKYKSLALHAEVKLAEALERCTRVCPTAYTSEGEEKPNKLKTAVCCQLLGEFAELCGPFSAVLRSIKDELVSGAVAGAQWVRGVAQYTGGGEVWTG